MALIQNLEQKPRPFCSPLLNPANLTKSTRASTLKNSSPLYTKANPLSHQLNSLPSSQDGLCRCLTDRLEVRSDNGCHYGAKVFRDEIRRLGINHTRTMVNTPKGNSVVERFFKSLKEERVWQHQFRNFKEAKTAVDKWVMFYNTERPHQALGYETPQRYYAKQYDLSLRKIA